MQIKINSCVYRNTCLICSKVAVMCLVIEIEDVGFDAHGNSEDTYNICLECIQELFQEAENQDEV